MALLCVGSSGRSGAAAESSGPGGAALAGRPNDATEFPKAHRWPTKRRRHRIHIALVCLLLVHWVLPRDRGTSVGAFLLIKQRCGKGRMEKSGLFLSSAPQLEPQTAGTLPS